MRRLNPLGDLAPQFGNFLERWRPFDAQTFPKCPALIGSPLGQVLASINRKSKLASCFNRFLEPDQIEAEGGVIVFLEEAQNARYWGVPESELALDDPSVVTTANEAVVNWEVEADRLSGFLQLMLSWQAVNGGWRYSKQLVGIDLAGVLESRNLKPIEHGVRHSGLDLFSIGSSGVLVRDENAVCYMAAPTKKAWIASTFAVGQVP